MALLDPIRRSIQLLRIEVDAGRVLKVQPATAHIISAVRSALNLTQCLNRDSSILRLHPSLARERKQVLSTLAHLVHKARQITIDHLKQSRSNLAIGVSLPLDHFRDDLDAILDLADQVLHKIRHFLLVAHRYMVPLARLPLNAANSSLALNSPVAWSTHSSRHPGGDDDLTTSQSQNGEDTHSSTDTATWSDDTGALSTYPSSSESNATVGIYTTSEIRELLDESHNCVLSTVAVFIGHAHIHSRSAHPSSHAHLIDMTRDVIEKVREMLVAVESISKQISLQPKQAMACNQLTEAREALYLATTGLVTAARVATSGPFEAHSTAPDEELNDLLNSATALLRAANECTVGAEKCLQGQVPDAGAYAISLADNHGFALNLHRTSSSTTATRNPADGVDGSRAHPRSRHTISMLGRKVDSLHSLADQFHSGHEFGQARRGSDGHAPQTLRPVRRDQATPSPTIPSLHNALNPAPVESSRSSARFTQPRSQGVVISCTEIDRPTVSSVSLSNQEESRLRSASLSSAQTDLSRHSSPPASTNTSLSDDAKLAETLDSEAQSLDLQERPPRSARTPSLASDWLHTREYGPEEVSFNAEGSVIGGTLRGLVERMTLHDTPIEASFSHTFFLTFRMFTSPVELTRALIARFLIEAPKDGTPVTPEDLEKWQLHKIVPIRLRVYNVFKTWLELHWRSETDSAALMLMTQWIQSPIFSSLRLSSERFLALIERRSSEADSSSTGQERMDSVSLMKCGPVSAPPSSIVSKHLLSQLRANPTLSLTILEFDPTELARQITLLESRLYCSISPEEIIGQEFGKKSAEASHVRAMSGMTTRCTGWIMECILNEDDTRKRSQVLKYCIKLGSVS